MKLIPSHSPPNVVSHEPQFTSLVSVFPETANQFVLSILLHPNTLPGVWVIWRINSNQTNRNDICASGSAFGSIDRTCVAVSLVEMSEMHAI